ncbi:nucleotidyltransferase family protein [Parasediminibacterium sp. JCM 36343]|uniref:nucleotidyltransferase family protein n=1 Tax=Parasediminibacterium sp. JCM 36343 TaxID=3374279 RepID=UPI0039794EFE
MEKIVAQHLEEIKKLFLHYGAESAYLFGSAAKDTATEKSDIDFLFSFPANLDYETYANNYFSLAHSLESLLNKRVDLVAEKTLQNPYLIESINESKIQLL